MPSVEDALALLAARTAGGRSHFEGFDVDLGHTLAARVSQGIDLTTAQRNAGWRMLRKYSAPLAALGLDFTQIPRPDGVPAPPLVDLPPTGVKIACQGDKIVVRGTKFTDAELLKAIPNGRWVKSHQAWTFPASPTSARSLHQGLQSLRPEVSDGFTALVDEAESLVEHAKIKDAEDLPPIPNEVLPSWMHQRRAFYFAEKMTGAVLNMAMGTGKSACAVNLIRESGAQSVLIVCPDRVCDVWEKQFRIHGPGGLFHVFNGKQTSRSGKRSFMSIKDRTRAYDELVNGCRCGKVHVIVSNFSATAHEPFASWSLEQKWDYLVIDECHKLKSTTGVWSKWASKMQKNTQRRLGLTGTLMPQTPLDVFGQYRAIDPDVFGKSHIAFEKRYAIKGGYEGREFRGMNPATFEEFSTRLHSLAFTCGNEMLDLPDVLPDSTFACTLGPAARKAYKAVDEEFYALIRTMDEEEVVNAPNVLVKMLRLAQITGGAVGTDSGAKVEIDTSKASLLKEILEDIDHTDPVVVFCRFIHDLDAVQRVAQGLGRTYGELSGRRDDALTSEATLAEGVEVAAIQIQSGGTGIDLTRSHFAIYYSVGYSLADYLQSRARLHRPGQEQSVRFIHLVAENTIDEDIYEAIEDRKSVVEYAIAKRKQQR